MEMLEWIKKILDHGWGEYHLVTILPQESYIHDDMPPTVNEAMEYVVLVGYSVNKNEYVLGRVWRREIELGHFAWDQGYYVRGKFTDAITKGFQLSKF